MMNIVYFILNHGSALCKTYLLNLSDHEPGIEIKSNIIFHLRKLSEI